MRALGRGTFAARVRKNTVRDSIEGHFSLLITNRFGAQSAISFIRCARDRASTLVPS